MEFLLTSAVFILVFLSIVVILSARTDRKETLDELARRMKRPEPAEEQPIGRPRRRSRMRMLAALAQQFNLARKLEEVMWQAGIYRSASDVLLIVCVLFALGALAGNYLWNDWLLVLGSGAGPAVVPLLYVRFRRRRRLNAFSQQLPYALDIVRSSLEAGHSLVRGLQVVVDEFTDPLGTEFRAVLEQSRLGLPLPRALEDMLKRVPLPDLRLLVIAVKVQAEVGSSLAQIVGRLGEILRSRQRLQAQIRALTAQGRMGGMIVGLLPVLVLAAFSVVQPSYTRTLFEDPSGLFLLKVALGLDLAALLVIRRLLRVEY